MVDTTHKSIKREKKTRKSLISPLMNIIQICVNDSIWKCIEYNENNGKIKWWKKKEKEKICAIRKINARPLPYCWIWARITCEWRHIVSDIRDSHIARTTKGVFLNFELLNTRKTIYPFNERVIMSSDWIIYVCGIEESGILEQTGNQREGAIDFFLFLLFKEKDFQYIVILCK